MSTTRDEIEQWLQVLYHYRSTDHYMTVTIDTFEPPGESGGWPTYYKTKEEVQAVVIKSNGGEGFDRIMEVYSRSLSLESQLAERRAWHLD